MSEPLVEALETPPRRFVGYPEYQNSVEWVGRIPTHWQSTRVTDHTELINGFPFDSESFSLHEGVALVRIRDLDSEETEIRYVGPAVEAA